MGELGYDNFFFFHFHAGKQLLIFFRIRAQLPGPQQFFSDQTLFSSESLVAPHREQWPALSPPYKTRVRWWKSVHFVKQGRMFFVHYVNTIDNDTLELSLYTGNHQNNCHVCTVYDECLLQRGSHFLVGSGCLLLLEGRSGWALFHWRGDVGFYCRG